MLDERQHTYEQMIDTAAQYMVDEPMCQTIILRTGPTRSVREANQELNSLTEGAVALGLLVSTILDPENKGAVMVLLNGTAGQLGNLAGYMIKVKAGCGR